VSLTYREENNIGIIEFDLKDSKVNLLNASTLNQLDKTLDDVRQKAGLSALVLLSLKKDVFIAGADIKEIENITQFQEGESKAKLGQDIFNKLEDLDIPTIAVIDGVALGGGCELILACRYRLATFNEKVKIGLPEVNLGIIPGFGGTYRLPRLIGLAEGLKMILSGKPVNGEKALKLNLVDKLIPQKGLWSLVQEFIKEKEQQPYKNNKYQRKKFRGIAFVLNKTWIGQQIVFTMSSKSVMKLTKGFYPAPFKAIDVIKKNFYVNRTKGLAFEANAFSKLAVTEISKNLVQVFYLSEGYKRLKVEGAENIVPQTVKKAAVLGAGVMGGGIAQLFSYKGIWTRLKDINYDAIAKGYQAAFKLYRQLVRKRRLKKFQASAMMAHITSTLDYSGFANIDFCVEAVVENLNIKKKVFQELSAATSPQAILATNTSALSVTEIAKDIKDPSRVIGFHFFNPVHRMPLIEIITTPMTSNETIVTTLNFARSLGKIPILVKDSPGFVVNRILLGYINEAGRILEDCGFAALEQIDRCMTDFGMPMGPFALTDEIGLDIGIKVLHILQDGLGERFQPADIFESVYEMGYFGKKSGQGFYLTGKKRVPNPEVGPLIKRAAKSPFNEQQHSMRLIALMINEAAKCLEEKIVDGPSTIDVSMIFGTSFPAFRGGLLRYADHIGINYVVDTLKEFATELQSDRFQPADHLLMLQESKRGFFQ